MANREYNVRFLCTGNSARSVMAECAINRWARENSKASVRGAIPQGAAHPLTLELLNQLNYETKDLRSKSWDEFAAPDSPRPDFVFTACDQAAAEQCPVWPGQPVTAQWGAADPAAFEGTEDQKRRFFSRIYRELENRIKIFTKLYDRRGRKFCAPAAPKRPRRPTTSVRGQITVEYLATENSRARSVPRHARTRIKKSFVRYQ
jgi:protein-tyrosine-phosphatase